MRARSLVLGSFLALMAFGGSAYAEPPQGHVAPSVPASTWRLDGPRPITPRFDRSWERVVKDAFDDWQLLVGRAALMVPPGSVLTPPPAQPAPPASPSPSLSNAVLELGAVKIEPPSQSAADTHGQSGLLLGFQLRLPWMIP